MSADNLRAVALVVRIVRELDRRHGFVAAGRRPRRDPGALEAEAREPVALAGDSPGKACTEPEKVFRRSPDAASERRQASILAPAQDAEALGAPPANRPEMAPQALETTGFAPEKDAFANALDEAVAARDGSQNDLGAGLLDEAYAPPVAAPPPPGPAARRAALRRPGNGAASA
jgi:hypothetical protein